MMRYDNLVEKAIAYSAYNGKIKRKYNLELSIVIPFVISLETSKKHTLKYNYRE